MSIEGTPYQNLSPREQVFHLNYWGHPIENFRAPDQPARRFSPYPFAARGNIGRKVLAILNGQEPIAWHDQSSADLLPVPDAGTSPLHHPGLLLIYDIEHLDRLNVAADHTPDRTPGVVEFDFDDPLFDAAVTGSPEYLFAEGNRLKPDKNYDFVRGYLLWRGHSEDRRQTYSRELTFGVMGTMKNYDKPVLFDIDVIAKKSGGFLNRGKLSPHGEAGVAKFAPFPRKGMLRKGQTTFDTLVEGNRRFSRMRNLGVIAAFDLSSPDDGTRRFVKRRLLPS